MEPYGGIIMFNLIIITFLGSGHPQMPITVSLINRVQGSHKILMKNKKLVPYMYFIPNHFSSFQNQTVEKETKMEDLHMKRSQNMKIWLVKQQKWRPWH